MMKRWLTLLLLTLATAYADTYFLLVDPEADRVVYQVGDSAGLTERCSPGSTFKIPLSLMGFDAGILLDEENPVWPYLEAYDDEREECRQAQTPRSWMTHCCVWYSQEVTRRLGMNRFQAYVDAFEYGNRDLTGDPGKNNGLTRAWIFSSLLISCEEQIAFIKKLVEAQLPVSDYAYAMTRKILFVDQLSNGWRLFGKTGLGIERRADGALDRSQRLGWFVGWVEKGDRRFLFALNLRRMKEVPPPSARHQIVKELLSQTGILSEP
jgi:beta-lactamase class D